MFRCNKPAGHGVVDLRRGARASRATSTSTRSASGSRSTRIAQWAKLTGARRADRRRPAPRGRGPDAEPRVEAADAEDALVRGRDGVGRDRPGPGHRHAAPDGARRRGRSRTAGSCCARTSCGDGGTPVAAAAPSDSGSRPRRSTPSGGHARGGERARHRLARAARRRSRSAARPARPRWWPTPGSSGRRASREHAAARLVHRLRAGRAPEDRARGAGRARRQRRRGRGAGGARDPGPLLRSRARRRPAGGVADPRTRRTEADAGTGRGIDRRLLFNVDWVLLGTALLLALARHRDDLLARPTPAPARSST